MNTELRTILQVNARDVGGGAERIATGLFAAYRARGLDSYLAVGRKTSDDPGVLHLSTGEGRRRLYRRWRRVADRLGGPIRVLDEYRGIESFHYPATYRLPTLPPNRPDVIHLHNLHGGYFDLRALPWLSRQSPLVLTLHDAWLLSGHCSHAFACDRWKKGCGSCPDLSIYPALRRDRTAENWQRKREIYGRSRLYVAAPCNWLMDCVRQSIIAPALVDAKVIPNGVDLTTFRPGDRATAREALNIDPDVHVLLFVASGIRGNMFKDYDTIRAAVRLLIRDSGDKKVVLMALGEGGRPGDRDDLPVRFIPFESNPTAVARFYQAADVYVHASRAETFPLTVLEALACGTPVVATAVGGIPEQIRSLPGDIRGNGWQSHPAQDATGVLVAPGDSASMAHAVKMLLSRHDLRDQMARNAARDAKRRFDLQRQCDSYLSWYEDILARLATTNPDVQ